jgi:exodeoxyribonuclease VII small subunit
MKDYTYTQAMQRLEAILAQLEEGSSNVDTLAELVKEAAELVKFCRAKLRKTEYEVQNAFEGMG